MSKPLDLDGLIEWPIDWLIRSYSELPDRTRAQLDHQLKCDGSIVKDWERFLKDNEEK